MDKDNEEKMKHNTENSIIQKNQLTQLNLKLLSVSIKILLKRKLLEKKSV